MIDHFKLHQQSRQIFFYYEHLKIYPLFIQNYKEVSDKRRKRAFVNKTTLKTILHDRLYTIVTGIA